MAGHSSVDTDSIPLAKVGQSIKTSTRDTIQPETNDQYIVGWRLRAITVALLISIFIVQMEASIVSTAVIDITDHLGGFEKSSWVFTAYLLTYCGLQMIWAKFSDIIGRKPALMSALAIFIVFSGICGASQTLVQLIMFRWVQGVGGCGVFALTQLIFFELVPPQKWPAYVSLVTAMVALALICGPLLGGAITSNGSWRWIFLLNVPIGALAGVGLFFTFPERLATEPAYNASRKNLLSLSWLRRLDFFGALMLIGACILLVTGLQEAALGRPWNSKVVLVLIICAVPCIVFFFMWQWYITTYRKFPEPVFPWRFCQSRICLGMIINTYLSGTIYFVCIVQIPQRFTTLYGLSPFQAAVRLLAFGAFTPFGSVIGAALMGKPKIPPVWINLIGAILQIFGTIFLSRISTSSHIDSAQYAFQFLTGLGCGFVNAALILLVPYAMEKRDLAVGTSAVSQFRVLGGMVGIAIATSVSTPYIRNHLDGIVNHEVALELLQKTDSIHQLTGATLNSVREVFGDAFNLQIKVLIGFAAAQVPVTFLMWTNVVASPGRNEP